LSWEPAPSEFFTGSARFGPLSEPQQDDGLMALGVHFEPGARTNWHHHPGGQVLYVASGAGYVQNAAGETVKIAPGDVVTIPSGEVHWHGATAESYLMHLSLTTHGATVWEGPVTDAEYETAGE
ncbi:MAG: cupin domain-containing protein, partial [Acidimicrobiia bacterium]